MFPEDGFLLSPINFFQIHGECRKLKTRFPQLAKVKGDEYLLSDTTSLTSEKSL